jgi:hypothetical protein
MKAAAMIIQKYWQGYAQRQRYQRMRVGYMRLQALIRSRVLSHRFRHLRGHIVGLQVSSFRNSVIFCMAMVYLLFMNKKF